MSAEKWSEAWERVLPEELRSDQQRTTLIESVTDIGRVVYYICKSPFVKANADPNTFDSDKQRIFHRIDAASHLNKLITETTRMPKYRDQGTLSLSRPEPSEAG